MLGEKGLDGVGYINAIENMAEVKEFFGKSAFYAVESPLVYVPVILLCAGIGIFWYFRRRTLSTHTVPTDQTGLMV